jgi:hypothetical protein
LQTNSGIIHIENTIEIEPDGPQINFESLEPAEREMMDIANIDTVGDELDEGKAVHDEVTVNSVKEKAISLARSSGIIFSALQEKEALGLFPKVFFFFLSNFIF